MEFHLIVNGKQEGPFSVEELEQQGITPESEVWAPGMSDWKQAGDVPELTAVLQRAEFEASQQAARAAERQATTGQPYEPVAPPRQEPPRVPPYTPVQEPPKKKSGCTPWLIAALILAILFATMVFTCPKPQDHKAAIQEVTKAWVDDKVDENLDAITGVGGVFGELINKALKELTGLGTDKVISNYLDVKNYLVCSVGRMKIGDNEKMVSLGLFGHVFTFGKEDIEKAWTQAMDEYEANHQIAKPDPLPQQDEGEDPQDEGVMPDSRMLPDSIMGVEVPEGMDSMVNQMANEAIRMAKEWAKQQIDNLGK